MLLEMYKDNLIFYSSDPKDINIDYVERLYTTKGVAYAIPTELPGGYLCLKALGKKYPGSKATPQALEIIKDIKDRYEKRVTLKSTHKFRVNPYDFQVDVLDKMLKFNKLALLLEMGLGKTYIALNYIEIKKVRALVLCPKVVLNNWEVECKKYTNLKCKVYPAKGAIPSDTQLLIVNYDKLLVPKAANAIRNFNPECVFFDEASRLKSYKSKRSTIAERLFFDTPYKYLLTGTLILGNPMDVYQPFKILNPDIFGNNYYKFRAEYAVLRAFGKIRYIVGFKNLDKLKATMQPYSVILNREDCIELPGRVFETHYYKMTQEQLDYTDLVTYHDNLSILNADMNVNSVLTKINKLRQILSGFVLLPNDYNMNYCNTCTDLQDCINNGIKPYTEQCKLCSKESEQPCTLFKSNPKLELLQEDLSCIEGKVIIWAFFKKDLELIQKLLIAEKYKYVLASDKKSDEKFQNNDEIKVYLGQISTGIGTTLTKAQTTIYYSHSLSLEHRLQSMDRNYRISQEKSVLVIDYVCDDSLEKQILYLLNKKEDVKKFIHSNIECTKCASYVICFATGVKPYAKKCILFGSRKNIERKVILHVGDDQENNKRIISDRGISADLAASE